MTDDDLRLLRNIHTGLSSTFYGVRFTWDGPTKAVNSGDSVEGALDASDLPNDLRALLDATPKLLARVAEQEELLGSIEAAFRAREDGTVASLLGVLDG